MKKLKLLLVVLLALVVTGCGNSDAEKTMTCTRTLNQDNLKMDLKYTVVYQGNYVKQVTSVETITTDDEEVLNTYKTSVEKVYAPYQDLEYYDTNVSVEGNTMTSTVNINYEKLDVDKLIEIDSANGQLFSDGKITISTMENLYNQVGATCTKN